MTQLHTVLAFRDNPSVGLLSLHISIPESSSLKEKRNRLKPILVNLHRKFNVTTAEVGLLDRRNEAIVACAMVSNDPVFTHRCLSKIIEYLESTFPDFLVLQNKIEFR